MSEDFLWVILSESNSFVFDNYLTADLNEFFQDSSQVIFGFLPIYGRKFKKISIKTTWFLNEATKHATDLKEDEDTSSEKDIKKRKSKKILKCM